jgi:SAM-dependent methyltransferase
MNISQFYERYWERPATVDAEIGLEVMPRKSLLRQALRDIPTGASVLDAGCGVGQFSIFINELGFNVVGVDVSTNAINLAHERYPYLHFQPVAIENGLPFQDETFAAAWFSEVLEHLFDTHQALSELNRVLQPGGMLVLTTPYHGIVKNLIIAIKGFDRHYNPYISHIRFFSRRSLTNCLERAGFEVRRWSGVGRSWAVWKSQVVVCTKVRDPGPAPEITG